MRANMPPTGHRQVNEKPFKIAINSRESAPFYPLDLQKTHFSEGSTLQRSERDLWPGNRKKFVEPVGRVLGEPGEHVGQPELRVDVVHFGRDDDAVHGGGALSAAIGAGEQPRLSSKCYSAQRSFRGIVRQADT